RVRTRFAIMGLPQGNLSIVSVEATNRSAHSVRVAAAGFETQIKPAQTIVVARMQPLASIPGVINARDSGSTYLSTHELTEAGLDLDKPVRSWVRLATGGPVISP